MNQTQGVILIMFGALVLWLMWSPNSPTSAGASGGAGPGVSTSSGGSAPMPPNTGLPGGYKGSNLGIPGWTPKGWSCPPGQVLTPAGCAIAPSVSG